MICSNSESKDYICTNLSIDSLTPLVFLLLILLINILSSDYFYL